MWIKKAFYQVPREERLEFNFKLEEVYKSYGKYIEIIEETPFFFGNPDDIAYLEHNHMTGEFHLKCGRFWFQEENLCPVVAMTHELGHYIDATQNFGGDMREYNRTLGTLEIEVRAWEFGIKVCRDMGLVNKYGQMIFDYAKECLESYFSAWSLPNDRHFGFNGRRPSFTEAIQRLQQALGMEIKTEYIETPKKQKDFLDLLQELQEVMESRRVAECNLGQLELETEEMTPLERVRKKKIEAKRNLKKSLGCKGWEL
jgi:hypothetical protein